MSNYGDVAEAQTQHTTADAESPRFRADYDAAARELATLLGGTAEEIVEALRETSAPTRDCLQLFELEDVEELPVDRTAHVKGCSRCAELVAAVLAPAPTARVDEAVQFATARYWPGEDALAVVGNGIAAISRDQLCDTCKNVLADHEGHPADAFDRLLAGVGLTDAVLQDVRETLNAGTFETWASTARECLSDSVDDVKEFARRHPAPTIAAALAVGVGVLLAMHRQR